MQLTAPRLYLLLSGMAIFYVTALFVYEPVRIAPMMLVLFAAVLGVLVADGKLGLLSWSAGIPMFYLAFFLGLPLVNSLVGGGDPSEDARIAAALYVMCAGLVAFALGTLFMRLTRRPKPTYDALGLLSINVTPRLVFILLGIGSASLLWSYAFGYFGLIATTGNEVTNAAGAISATGLFLSIGHVMAWNVRLRRGGFLYLGILSTALMCLVGLLANSKGQLLAPFVLIALCAWGATDRFPYRLVVISVLLYVFVAFPFVTAARFAFPVAEELGSRFDLADVMMDYLLSARWIEDASDLAAVGSLGDRLLPYFATIIQQAGTTVPYMEGRTIVQGIEIMAPRILYADKPDMSIGNWTGQVFGEVNWQDDTTNLSPTFIGEFYMNFGLAGVFVGMFLTGILAVWVDRYLIVNRRSWTMPILVLFVGSQEAFVGHSILPFIKNAALWVPLLLLLAYLAGATARRRAGILVAGRGSNVNPS